MSRGTKVLIGVALVGNFVFIAYLMYRSISADYEIQHLLDVVSDLRGH